MIDSSQAEKWLRVLAEIAKSMKQEGLTEEETARVFEHVAAMCRPTYVISRERAATFNDIVPVPAREALAEWMRTIAHLGGAATKGISTERKAASSRENGKKGGRPRKTINKETR
jgi:hypothetical protein